MENLKITDYCGGLLEVSAHEDGSIFIELFFREEKQTFAIEDADIPKLISHLQQRKGLPTNKKVAQSIRDACLHIADLRGTNSGSYIEELDIDKYL